MRHCACIFFLCLTGLFTRPATSLANLQVGIATTDVTPSIDGKKPVWLAGFARGRQASSIHAPLLASAVVFTLQGKSLALVSIDSIGLGFSDIAVIRETLQKQKIVDDLIIASTHSHQSPDVIGLWGKDMSHPGWDEDYVNHIIQQSIQAVKLAKKSQKPSQIKFKRLDFPLEEQLMFDFRPPTVKDPGISLLHILHGDKPAGSVVVWSNHPEAMGEDNTALSPDYPASMRQALKDAGHGPTVFMVGAIGGLLSPGTDQVIPDAKFRPLTEKGAARAQAIGIHVAERIKKAFEQKELKALNVDKLHFASTDLMIPINNPHFLQGIKAGIIRGHSLDGERIVTRVSFMQIGELFLLGIPGEIFPEIIWGGIPSSEHTDFPQAYREEPPLAEAMAGKDFVVIGLADDELGYIIPKSSWDTKAPNFLGQDRLYYGEENSIGPEAAPMIHKALLHLIEQSKKSLTPEGDLQNSSPSR